MGDEVVYGRDLHEHRGRLVAFWAGITHRGPWFEVLDVSPVQGVARVVRVPADLRKRPSAKPVRMTVGIDFAYPVRNAPIDARERLELLLDGHRVVRPPGKWRPLQQVDREQDLGDETEPVASIWVAVVVLTLPIGELGVPRTWALKRVGIDIVGELVQWTEADLRDIQYFGALGTAEVKVKLKRLGLGLRRGDGR